MSLIEEFTETEKERLNWLQKLSANYPDVTETRLLARGYAEPEIKPDRIIRPSIFRRSGYFLVFLVTFLSWLLLLSTWRGHRDPLWVYLAGMTIRGIFIAWGEIVETAIMRQSQPRKVDRFLVVFTRDGTVQKLNLFLFGISDRKLAAVVEYYKAQGLR